jgi:hypothetical protein
MPDASVATDSVPTRLYFHHIPKTAGTSVREFLIERAGAPNVAPMLRSMQLREALREYARFPVITGHLLAIPGDVLPPDRVSLTVLRDPVDRVLSSFYFERNSYNASRRGPQGSSASIFDWLDALERDETQQGLNAHLDALWPLGCANGATAAGVSRVEAAKRALDAFDVVGLQSSLADSLALLALRMRWQPSEQVPYVNQTPGRPSRDELPESVIRRLTRLLAADLEIYEHGIAIFNAKRHRALQAAARASVRDGSPLADALHDDSPAAISGPASAAGETERPDRERAVGRSAVPAIRLEGVEISGEVSEAGYLQVGERALLKIRIDAQAPIRDLNIGFSIRDGLDALVFATNTRSLGDAISLTTGQYVAIFKFPNQLGIGEYQVSATLHEGSSYMEGCIDYAERACQFLVVDHLADYFEGRFGLHVDATVLPSAGEGHVEVAPIDALGHQKLALLAHRNPALADFSARLEPLAQLAGITCAADAMVGLAITNTGSVAWPAFGKRAVMVSYHWIDHSGNMVLFDGMRTNLPHDVRPGERIELRCLLRAPEARGRMMLVWTLVQEHVAWFNDRNRASQYSCEIEVV